MRSSVIKLLRNRIYRSAAFGLCALFFVVTGIQYWSSKYFIVSFERPRMQVNLIFMSIAGTAPILGIVFGGQLIDRLGGYDSPEGSKRTAAISLVFCVLAMSAGLVAAFIPPGPALWRLVSVVSCICMQLFFGAAVLPPVTGILLHSAEKDELQVLASAMAMLLYNLFGYGLGSYLPGLVATWYLARGEEGVALNRAMQAVFFWAIIGTICLVDMYLATVAECRQMNREGSFTGGESRRVSFEAGPTTRGTTAAAAAAAASSRQSLEPVPASPVGGSVAEMGSDISAVAPAEGAEGCGAASA